jgi:hypothetical protein
MAFLDQSEIVHIQGTPSNLREYPVRGASSPSIFLVGIDEQHIERAG